MQFLSRPNRLGSCVFVACLLFELFPARGQSRANNTLPECNPANLAANHLPGDDYCHLGYLRLQWTSYDVARDVCSSTDCLPTLIQNLVAVIMREQDLCREKQVDELLLRRQNTEKLNELLLRQKITEMIATASLQVDGFLAEVDSESNHLREVRDAVTDRQSKSLSWSSLGSNIGTGGGAVGSALGLAARTATAGGWVGAVFGGFGSILGFVNYFQTLRSPTGCFPANGDNKSCPSFVCSNHGDAIRGCSPSMLYHVFDPPGQVRPDDQLFHSGYDAVIQNYLNQRRKNELIDGWKGDQPNLPKKATDKLTANHTSPMKLSITDLTDRQNRLADLRALVARINRDLSRLTGDLTEGLAQCSGDAGIELQNPAD